MQKLHRSTALMPATRHRASSLLHYNADFKVLICRECQYAIQKSAIDSHLLKHKIYRGDRQNLLAEVAQLDILEPADVGQPCSSSLPIEALPILHGYRCSIARCQHLTVSEKRAKRHWSEVHGQGKALPSLSEINSSVNLQTFFRGTKVKYFQVSPSAGRTVNGADDKNGFQHAQQSDVDLESHYMRTGVDTANASPLLLDSQVTNSFPPGNTKPQASIHLDLEMFKYFHHFVSFTAPTLPGSSDYWQMKITSEALRHNGMMCGLLAIAVCHLAVFSTDQLDIRLYIERQGRLLNEFSSTLNQNTQSAMTQRTSEPEDPSRMFVDQIMSLMHCAKWAALENSIDRALLHAPGLEVILDAIRGCNIPTPDFSSSAMPEGGSQWNRSNTVQTRRRNDGSDSTGDSTLPVLLEYVRRLPLRMTEVLGKPKSAEDLFATLSAIDALVECCEISFVSDQMDAVWQSASEWLTKVSARFNAMLARHDPATMVVLAHWAAILVKRAELVGCWFLKGSSKSILQHIVNHLSATKPTVLCLVDSLLINQFE